MSSSSHDRKTWRGLFLSIVGLLTVCPNSAFAAYESAAVIPVYDGTAVLVSPNEPILDETPAYTWQQVSDSTWYYLWVNDASGTRVIGGWFPSVEAGCDGTTCSLTPPTPLANEAHRWWIKTWNGQEQGPWSSGMSFFVGGAPEATALTFPSGIITNPEPAFIWEEVSNATFYFLWVNDASGARVVGDWYSSIEANCNGETCAVRPPAPLAAEDHRWWVKTWNPNDYGPWSQSKSFTIAEGSEDFLADAATPLYPAVNTAASTPTYEWERVSGSTSYFLWVNDASDAPVVQETYSPLEARCNEETCSVTPSITLASEDHTWWVGTSTADGAELWSQDEYFSNCSGNVSSGEFCPNGELIRDFTIFDYDDGPGIGKFRSCTPTMDCTPTRSCTFTKSHDDRNCKVCFASFFGNCVWEGNDPLCEAAKAAQNLIYEVDYAAKKLDCERLKTTEKLVCEAEKTANKLDCERLKTTQILTAEFEEAAIHYAKQIALDENPRPIPTEVKEALWPFFEPELLESVRWTDDHGDLLSIQKWATEISQRRAITLDSVIVFKSEDDAYDVGLWAHELEHVKQYRLLGIDGFAQYYTHKQSTVESLASDQSGHVCRAMPAEYACFPN